MVFIWRFSVFYLINDLLSKIGLYLQGCLYIIGGGLKYRFDFNTFQLSMLKEYMPLTKCKGHSLHLLLYHGQKKQQFTAVSSSCSLPPLFSAITY